MGKQFWLSLVPFVIRGVDESAFSVMATAAYGVVLRPKKRIERLLE